MVPGCLKRCSKRWRGGRTPHRIPAMWVLAVILLVALMIPIAAILVDSPLGRSIARRLEGGGREGGGAGGGEVKALERGMDPLGGGLADLTCSLAGVDAALQLV